MHLVVGAELQRLQQGGHYAAIVMAVRGAHHSRDLLAVGRPGGFEFLHQVGEGLFIHYGKEHFADNPIRVSKCRLGQLTEQRVLAGYPFQFTD